jgi:(E)-4-hydroxy-3-methylbut-2-enyl-diphosphate synthase
VNALESRLEDINDALDVAIIGCYVNGPGEAKVAHIGLTGSSPSNMVFVDGKPSVKLENSELVDSLEKMIREKVAQQAAVIGRG